MPRNIRRNVDIQSTIKDYIVPIIGWIIVLIIIFLIIRKREKEGNRKEIMSRVKERIEEFQPEDIEESQDTIESA